VPAAEREDPPCRRRPRSPMLRCVDVHAEPSGPEGRRAVERDHGGRPRTVLVAYATKHGSTAEVARFIADRLGERGPAVDTVPARDVRGAVDGYDLVVLGGALYSGRWHREAHRFLKRHRADLDGLRIAVFGMGPRNPTPEAFAGSRAQLARALARRDWLRPMATAVFGGVDPPSRRPEKHRDARDWAAIEAWIGSLLAGGAEDAPTAVPRSA
jgi:menaquinone-dependent protoporphyrinogen oxidase